MWYLVVPRCLSIDLTRRDKRRSRLRRKGLAHLRDELLNGSAVPRAARTQLAVVLETVSVRELVACLVEQRHKAVLCNIVERRLLWLMAELDAKVARMQLVDDRLHATGVVVPSTSASET